LHESIYICIFGQKKFYPALKIIKSIFSFYLEGFRNMTTGRKLWVIIAVKLFLIFIVLKLVFFPDFLESRFNNDRERGNWVIKELTKTN